MAKAYPQTESLRQLRHTRNKMRKVKLAIGADGRNRTVLWPFVSKTGRSQPKASEWIFSPAVWLRFLIKPEPGRAIAYIDWSGMEFLIAAALSNCQPMLDLYASGSPYIGFAKRFDEAPPDATKKSHPHIHERYKVGCLGAQYSMQHVTLAQRLGVSTFAAHEMLSQHRGLFSKYWAWVEDWIAHALNTGDDAHARWAGPAAPASPNSTRARSATGLCRRPAPTFCGLPASRATAAACSCAGRSTMRC